MKKKCTFLSAALCLLSPLAVTAPAAAQDTAAEAESQPKADVEITITGNDQMQFDKNELEVTTGQVVALTFVNIGKLPREVMGHNVVILKPGNPINQFAMKAMAAKDHGYIPQDPALLEKVVAHTQLLGPGEKDTIVFTAPEPRKYEYFCSFPGHFSVMKGVLTVKAK